MATTSGQLLRWSPCILGILASLFAGFFALDAFSPGKPLLEALPDLVMHLLPALWLLAVVAASWRRTWIGGVAFIGVGVLYAVTTGRDHRDWTFLVSGPLLVVGAIFIWS